MQKLSAQVWFTRYNGGNNFLMKWKRFARKLNRLHRLNIAGEIAAHISHEVRNPMTTVRGYLQLFQNRDTFAEYRQEIDTMIKELDRANGIITECLFLAKDKAVYMNKGNINTVVQSLFPLLQADAFRMGHCVNVDSKDIPDCFFDKKEIRQLILNLVRNGLEAMEYSGAVTISTYHDNNANVVAIQDEGSGIPEEVWGKLGTPFVTTKNKGAGLGLSVCYRIAQRHGAKIEVKTSPEGTTFFVKFKI